MVTSSSRSRHRKCSLVTTLDRLSGGDGHIWHMIVMRVSSFVCVPWPLLEPYELQSKSNSVFTAYLKPLLQLPPSQ